ncbi:MAG: hypothetical protein IT168_13560 [Bryobacterales bacterium]|nr:hypothetical protein [Bryobacterales bacterium]
MTAVQVAELPDYSGIFFDPDTGKSYLADGTDTGFTFERARWTGPWNLHFSWPFLNPISFATHETGLKVLNFARQVVPSHMSVELDESQKVVGPFSRTIERLIVVKSGSTEESFSAGMLANSIIRNGEKNAKTYFAAELRYAGFRL